ncbi:peptidoglycan/LPS O-acetylase OafA/YrhL [Microbacterium sp. W4I4]|uniref:acyltransferase family protein n=1 Tax=Microbacterium sp. W4I4 TaxID=3042295 RepID=UPI00277D89BC|nr:acyltransferase family protein [Microbacterium sp. W4I4]MDQ0613315.1 peptidoglycan/LPS O-acetylase OafA/YrhL [Microbacterium sp. W4I4]
MRSTATSEAATPVAKKRGFRTDVQGLRAIAVGLVLLYHAGVPFVGGGYIGVDVFFVISGFLISSHLLEAIERNGRVDFGEFYARRIRRILPASLTVALMTALAAVILYPPLGLERVLKDGLATILYVPNVWFAIQNTDYLADHSPSPFQHYWSLGVEEQFYLFWPLILMGLTLMLRNRRRVVVAIAVLGIISLILGVALTSINQPAAFFLLPTRAWELIIGGLVGALLLRGGQRLPRAVEIAGGWMGLALVLGCAVFYDDSTVFPGTAAILPTVGTAAVIYFGSSAVKGGPSTFLSIRPMQFVGLISYSLYLVHWPLLIVTQAAIGEQNPLRLSVRVLLGIVLAVPLAWLLFRFVESPFRSPRVLTERRPRLTLFGTLTVTLVLALAFVWTTSWAQGRDTVVSGPAIAAPAAPENPPRGTEVVPSNMTPTLGEVANDLPPMYSDGCHHDVLQEEVQSCRYGDLGADAATIALFGDSHSAQWFPALDAYAAQTGGTAIDTYTKSSCPAVDTTVLDKDVPYSSCDRWRAAVLDHLVQQAPDTVVISSYSGYALPSADGDARERAWSEGVSRTVKRLVDAGSQVLVIADTPRFVAPPPTCVSANPSALDRCAGDRSTALDPKLAAAERLAVEAAGGRYADLSDYICDSRSCPVVVGNLLVYRDVNHLTPEFVEYLAPLLAPDLSDLLGVSAIRKVDWCPCVLPSWPWVRSGFLLLSSSLRPVTM